MKHQTKFKQTEIGKIPEGWKIRKLGDYLTLNYGKGLPEEKRINGKFAVFGSNGIVGWNKEPLVNGPGIIIGRKGSVGEIKIYIENFWPIDTTYYITNKDTKLDLHFLYYKLLTLGINTMNSHAAVPGLNREDVYRIETAIPSLPEQHSIAKILSDLDSKIELNNKMNKKLEAIGQALFKKWFVDERKDDWEVLKLGEIISKLTTGLNPRANFVLGKGDNFYVTIKNMGNQELVLDSSCDKIDDEAIAKINARSKLQAEDILFSGVATIGRVFYIDKEPKNWNVNESIFTLRANKDKIYPSILYNLLLSKDFQDYSISHAQGSVQKGVRISDLKEYEIALPKIEDQKNINLALSYLLDKLKINQNQNKYLLQIRDSLLPKLMSGDIRVK